MTHERQTELLTGEGLQMGDTNGDEKEMISRLISIHKREKKRPKDFHRCFIDRLEACERRQNGRKLQDRSNIDSAN